VKNSLPYNIIHDLGIVSISKQVISFGTIPVAALNAQGIGENDEHFQSYNAQ
jgi:hypothetical protein